MARGLRISMVGLVVVATIVAAGELLLRFNAPPEKPIIAQLYANPQDFIGRKIEIYGLVIESGADSFLLQDVSQRPLKVRGNAKAGDQLTIIGTLRSEANSIIIIADSLRETKVVAGGGCC